VTTGNRTFDTIAILLWMGANLAIIIAVLRGRRLT
jgi:hypothetical protein